MPVLCQLDVVGNVVMIDDVGPSSVFRYWFC